MDRFSNRPRCATYSNNFRCVYSAFRANYFVNRINNLIATRNTRNRSTECANRSRNSRLSTVVRVVFRCTVVFYFVSDRFGAFVSVREAGILRDTGPRIKITLFPSNRLCAHAIESKRCSLLLVDRASLV